MAALLLIAATSCHQKVDWTPPAFEQKPIVNSIIKIGSPLTVKVSLAVAFNAQATPVVDNAEVFLYVNNEYIETLEYIGDGLYKSQYITQEERDYRCEVVVPGFQPAICSTYMSKRKNIISFEHINKAGVDEEGLTHPAIKITFENEPNKLLYYEVVITLTREGGIYRPRLLNITDPILLNEGLPIAVFSNELIEGNSYTMTINYSTGSATNANDTGWVTNLYPLQVDLRTICYHYYKFIKQQYLYELSTSEAIFSVGATSTYNLHSNVQNGYGIFAGFSSVKSEIINP
jgi:hypothetical protein